MLHITVIANEKKKKNERKNTGWGGGVDAKTRDFGGKEREERGGKERK